MLQLASDDVLYFVKIQNMHNVEELKEKVNKVKNRAESAILQFCIRHKLIDLEQRDSTNNNNAPTQTTAQSFLLQRGHNSDAEGSLSACAISSKSNQAKSKSKISNVFRHVFLLDDERCEGNDNGSNIKNIKASDSLDNEMVRNVNKSIKSLHDVIKKNNY